MSVAIDQVDKFWDYLDYYPDEDEDGYDGIHNGGVKGLREDAPDDAKKQYLEYKQMKDSAEKELIKI